MHFNTNVPNYNCETSEYFSTLNLHSQLHISTGLIPGRPGSWCNLRCLSTGKKKMLIVVVSEDISKKIRQWKTDISLIKTTGRSFPAFNVNMAVLSEINFFNVYLPITFTKTGNQTLPLQVTAKTLQPKGTRFKQDYKKKISRFHFIKEMHLNLLMCFNHELTNLT